MNLVVFFRAGLNFRGVARRGGRGESGRFLFACLKCGTSGRLSSEEESAVGGTEGPAAEIWKEAEGSGVGRAAEGWKVEGSGVGRAAGALKVEVGRVGSGIESICTAGLGKAGEIRSSKGDTPEKKRLYVGIFPILGGGSDPNPLFLSVCHVFFCMPKSS